MAASIARADGRETSEINMTPLIDVMLVLLIIFIITIPTQTNAVKIDNPSGGSPPPIAPPVVELAIDFDGSVYWNREPVDRAGLLYRIRRTASQSPQPEVHIGVDRFAKYERVAQTLADLQRNGMRQVGFVNDTH